MFNRHVGLKTREAFTGIAFLLPFLSGLTLFAVIPILYTLYITFVDFNRMGDMADLNFAGFANYIDVFGDKEAMGAYVKSFLYTIVYMPSMIIFSLLMAVAMNRRFRLKNLSRTMIFMPYVANIVAVAIVWNVILNPYDGPLNTLLRMLGITHTPMWLGDTALALPIVALIATWQNLAFQTIVFLAALQDVPNELYEAAKLDGASSFKMFTRVTLPWISPATFFLIVATIIGSTENFSNVYTLTKGGPGGATEVAAISIYKNAFELSKFSFASAQALILFLLLMIVTIIQWRGQKRWVHY